MATFQNLPQELLVDGILPLLPVCDVVATFQVNRFFAALGEDELFWRRRLEQDFSHMAALHAKDSGFKFLYSRLHKPILYVWGGSGHGRLGRPASPRIGKSMSDTQFWPMKLDIPGYRIVQLATGGWSFSALDSKGRIHVWGQMADGHAREQEGFASSSQQARTPMRLALPIPIRSISCGRGCSVALDQQGQVWCIKSWGRPFVFKPEAFDPSNPDNVVIQVTCGWTIMAALNALGNVYVWSVFDGQVGDIVGLRNLEFDAQRGNQTRGMAINGIIKCHTWTMIGVEPLKLPELPQLPTLTNGAVPHPQLVKIAAGDHFIIGLTDGGHMVKIDVHGHNRNWEYLPLFCEAKQVRALDSFRAEGGPSAPLRLKVSDISAQLHIFAVYSAGQDSIVLLGDRYASSTSTPIVNRELQNKGVISVELGHDHYAALLECGELLTWGTSIATGMGNPYQLKPGQPGGFASEADKTESLVYFRSIPHIYTPTRVRFDHELVKPRDRFVSAVAASGHHVGALVVDLEEGEPEEKERPNLIGNILRHLRF